ncbi:MAG: hypothetical protein QE263_05005 [Vampirovibrionales bacterium]|nr:hypothetical protein [Vampirovibrionales bacterium]
MPRWVLLNHRFQVLALAVCVAISLLPSAALAATANRLDLLTLTPDGSLQARVVHPAQATVFYRTVGNHYQVIWDLENTVANAALLAKTDWTALFQRQWPTLVSATVQAFSGPVVRVRLEWNIPEEASADALGEPLMTASDTQQPLLRLSRLLVTPQSSTTSTHSPFSLPAVASSVAITAGSAALQERIQQLETDRDAWQRKAEQQAQYQRTSVTSQPSADYTKLKEALETSKVSLAKAIATINKQNETLQALKGQVGELRTGLDSSTLDQQTYLNEELTKAEQTQKNLQQKLVDAERENAALKLVVDGLKKQQAALEEKQLSNAEALPTQDGWKKSGSK